MTIRIDAPAHDGRLGTGIKLVASNSVELTSLVHGELAIHTFGDSHQCVFMANERLEVEVD